MLKQRDDKMQNIKSMSDVAYSTYVKNMLNTFSTKHNQQDEQTPRATIVLGFTNRLVRISTIHEGLSFLHVPEAPAERQNWRRWCHSSAETNVGMTFR